ncbi:MAG: beta-galactosidase [Bryobacteraceae bacterium]
MRGTCLRSALIASLAAGICAAANVAEITGQLRIGTEFFLNRTETKQSIDMHFRLMRDYGITVVRIFVIWDDIERKPGEWNFQGYDWIYDAAAANNIKIAATLCAEDPPGWRKLTPFYHSRTNLNDPEIKRYAETYMDRVVTRYRSHPAQGVWLLMNEPGLKYNFEPSTMQAFGKWLEQRWGSLDALNQKWFQPLQTFSEVTVNPKQWEAGWTDYYSFVDWKEFNVENLCQHLRWIQGRIRALDSVHPTHLNQPGLTYNMMEGGQDPWQEGKIVDFVGASIHPAWHFAGYPRDEAGLLWSYSVDLLASAAGGRPWWVTELQSGPTVFTGRRPMNPTHGEMTRWLWDSYGAGAKAVVYWCWHPRTMGNEGGEWGLVSIDGKPNERAAATKEVADALKRLPALNEARPSAPKAAILYNRETLVLSLLDGRSQAAEKRGDEPVQSLVGCYRALYGAHVPVTFLDIPGLKAGVPKDIKVLYLPYSYAIDDQATTAIRDFVSSGGTVWADGLLGWKNEYGELRTRIPGGLGEVFGVEAADIDPVTEPFSVTASNEEGGQSWRLPLELKGAQVMLKDRAGRPFATKHRFGKGTAIFYTSAVSLAAHHRHNRLVESWIAAPALEANRSAPVTMTSPSREISFRPLEYAGGYMVVLSNWGKDAHVQLEFGGSVSSVHNALTRTPVSAETRAGNTITTLAVPAGAVVIVDAATPR